MCTRNCLTTHALLLMVLSLFAVGQVWAHCGHCGVGAPAKDKAGCATGACPVAGAAPTEAAHEVAHDASLPTINPAGLKALHDAKVPVTVLDARYGKYDDGVRIPGAKSLSPKATDREIGKALKSKQGLIVTYCANLKCPASGMLAKLLRGKGYENVIELPEGIEGWKAAGYPTRKAR